MTENEEIQRDTENISENKVETSVKPFEKKSFSINVFFNIFLLIAVAVLFVLHFTGKKNNIPETKAPVAFKGIGAIAFIDSDTLMEKYQYYKDTKAELEKFEQELNNEYKNKTLAFKNEYENYLKIGASLTLTEQKRREESLKNQQNDLLQLENNLANKLVTRKEEKNTELWDNILGYIKKFNEEKGYSLILAKSRMSGILYANDSLDITNAVIEGLNNEYKNKKENTKK